MTQTTRSLPSTTLNMGVSQSILKKAPRFFGSPTSILTELFQNSFRAGAMKVDITWNKETRVFQFKDNGCGCKPEDLLVVGESGWGEDSPAVDPAGIGAFSILRPEYCEQVTYRSKDWGMVLSADNLERGQVDVYHFDEQSEGMTIEIVLTLKADFVNQTSIAKARGRYPMEVSWTETPKESVVVQPYEILTRAHWGTINVKGVGTVEIGRHSTVYHTQHVVWQHAVMESKTVETALTKAAALHSKLAAGVFNHMDLVFTVDPICGVRPKLPDRNELIGDAHLDAACQKIVKAVMKHMLKPLRPDLWPSRLGNFEFEPKGVNDEHLLSPKQALLMKVPKKALVMHILHEWMIPHLFLQHFGYKMIDWDMIDQYNATTVQDDGYRLEIEWDKAIHYVRNTPTMAVDSESVAQSLCSQGVYAYIDAKATTDIVYTDLVCKEGSLVAFAKAITVNGTPVKWLLYDSEAQEICDISNNDPIFVTTLNPIEFYKSVSRKCPDTDLYVCLVIWVMYQFSDIYEYAEFEEDGEYTLKTWEIADELLQNALKVGAPALVRKDQIRNALGDLANWLRDARSKLHEAKEYMERIEQLDDKNPMGDDLLDLVWDFSGSTKMVFDAVEELGEGVSEAVKRLTQEVDTAFTNPPPEQR